MIVLIRTCWTPHESRHPVGATGERFIYLTIRRLLNILVIKLENSAVFRQPGWQFTLPKKSFSSWLGYEY